MTNGNQQLFKSLQCHLTSGEKHQLKWKDGTRMLTFHVSVSQIDSNSRYACKHRIIIDNM